MILARSSVLRPSVSIIPDRSLDQYKGYQRLSSLFIAVIKPSVLASFRFLLSYNARIAPSFKAKRLLKT